VTASTAGDGHATGTGFTELIAEAEVIIGEAVMGKGLD